ncbi:MAG: FAD-binding monooxygenase [Pseudomonadota bacterium]
MAGEGQDSKLPGDIVESISIANAKSIAEQPAILSNLALAQQVFNQNLAQQIALSTQQAMNQITMAAASKCVSMIAESTEADATDKAAHAIEDLGRFFAQVQAAAPGTRNNPPPSSKDGTDKD